MPTSRAKVLTGSKQGKGGVLAQIHKLQSKHKRQSFPRTTELLPIVQGKLHLVCLVSAWWVSAVRWNTRWNLYLVCYVQLQALSLEEKKQKRNARHSPNHLDPSATNQ